MYENDCFCVASIFKYRSVHVPYESLAHVTVFLLVFIYVKNDKFFIIKFLKILRLTYKEEYAASFVSFGVPFYTTSELVSQR